MTKERAREILEVGPNASPGEIRSAYLKLMNKVHPDHGGSSYLSKEVNAAKDLLLGE
jgi:curved DNA-binding protein CbpA